MLVYSYVSYPAKFSVGSRFGNCHFSHADRPGAGTGAARGRLGCDAAAYVHDGYSGLAFFI